MIKNKKLRLAAAAIGLGVLLSAGTLYAADEPTSLDADNMEYDMKTGLMTATGNVLMRKGNANVTGKYAEYNIKTQEGKIEGDVIAVKDDARVTCDTVYTDTKDHIIADGNVHGTQADKTFSGQRMDYFPTEEYVLIETGGTITSNDGTFTADKLEGYLKREYYKGTGNAHIISPPRKMEAAGDVVEYFKAENKAVLTGNAWAVQENNTMRGGKLTVFLDTEKAEASK